MSNWLNKIKDDLKCNWKLHLLAILLAAFTVSYKKMIDAGAVPPPVLVDKSGKQSGK